MSQTPPGGAPEQRLERTADELDHDLQVLEDHLDDAQRKARERRTEVEPIEAVAGDWEETRGAPGQGEDPEGAVPDRDPDGATTADATPDASGVSAAEADAIAEEHRED